MKNSNRIVYVLKSEKDNSVYVGITDDMGACLTGHNQGQTEETAAKAPWTLMFSGTFERQQPADEFKQFLSSQEGQRFIKKYIIFDPLSELKKLLATLPQDCHVFVMGGVALDGYFGVSSRRHDDVDLICWRKDAETIQECLKQMGYGIKLNYYKDRPDVPYRFETDEENAAISFNIVDKQADNSFLVSFNSLPQSFPIEYLGPIAASLDGVEFPAVQWQMLDALNRQTSEGLLKMKDEKPELYAMLGYKVDNNRNDRQLLDRLSEKASE